MIPNVWRKSERSNPSGNCVEVYWKKSSRSNGTGGSNCVEVRADDERVLVRDTKLGESSPVLIFQRNHWAAFIAEVKAGISCPIGGSIQTWISGPGWEMVDMTDPDQRLSFTQAEWDAFLGGVRDGEFDLK